MDGVCVIDDGTRLRRDEHTPVIETVDGDLIFDGNGGHIGYRVGDETVMLEDIAPGLRDYTDATLDTLEVGYLLGRDAGSAAVIGQLGDLHVEVLGDIGDARTEVLTAVSTLEDRIDGEIEGIEDDIASIEADIQNTATERAEIGSRVDALEDVVRNVSGSLSLLRRHLDCFPFAYDAEEEECAAPSSQSCAEILHGNSAASSGHYVRLPTSTGFRVDAA